MAGHLERYLRFRPDDWDPLDLFPLQDPDKSQRTGERGKCVDRDRCAQRDCELATEKSFQRPGTPLSSCSPRSAKAMPDPTTRGGTAPETTTSPGPAVAATRVPMWTASPATSAHRTSISPVWRPGPRLDTQGPNRFTNGQGALNGPSGSVKCGQHPVADGVDLPPPESFKLPADGAIVGVEQVSPSVITQLSCALGGRDNVGEHDQGEHAVCRMTLARAGEELLDLVQIGIAVAGEDEVVGAGNLNESRSGDVSSQILSVGLTGKLVVAAIQHQSGCLDEWQHCADVGLHHLGFGGGGGGARRVTGVASPLSDKHGILQSVRRAAPRAGLSAGCSATSARDLVCRVL